MATDDILSGALPADGTVLPEATAENALAVAGQEGVAAPAVAPNLQQTNKLLKWSDHRETPNIALELTADRLSKIGQDARREYEIDVQSRTAWVDRTKEAMDLAMQVAKTKTYPWPNSSNVIYPLMTNAAIQFAARAVPAIISGRNVVKGVVIGDDEGIPEFASDGQPAVEVQQGPNGPVPVQGPDGQPVIKWKVPPGEKRLRSERIGQHMSWQCLEEMEEWSSETDKLLHILPIAGCMFRKTYFDPQVGCNVSVLASSLNVVVNYWAKALERAPRVTEEMKLYPLEIKEAELADIYLPDTYGPAPDGKGDLDAPHDILEQHRWIDLDDDGYPEPYIVTIRKDTSKVLRVCARFDPDGVLLSSRTHKVRKIKPVHYYTQYDFLPNMEGGIYGMGFGQLLKPINDSINTSLNMLIDAGHRQVVGGGFIGKGLSMHTGDVRFKLGQYRPVNVPGNTIREAIVTIDTPEPSAVLLALLGQLVEAGKEISSVKDVLTGDASMSTMQPTTLLALIEQGLKVFTGIYKRVHGSCKKEYDKLYRLNRIYLEKQTSYRVGDEWRKVTQEDYAKGSGVEPVSDPSMVSDMQRLAKAGFLQPYQNDPYMDPIETRRRIFDAAQLENVDALFAKQQGPTPDMIAAAATLENEAIKTRADAIHKLSGAVLNLAKADAEVGAQAMAFVDQQFQILKSQLERLDERSDQGSAAAPEAAGSAGDAGIGLPQLEESAGNEGDPGAVLAGLQDGAGAGSPDPLAGGPA